MSFRVEVCFGDDAHATVEAKAKELAVSLLCAGCCRVCASILLCSPDATVAGVSQRQLTQLCCLRSLPIPSCLCRRPQRLGLGAAPAPDQQTKKYIKPGGWVVVGGRVGCVVCLGYCSAGWEQPSKYIKPGGWSVGITSATLKGVETEGRRVHGSQPTLQLPATNELGCSCAMLHLFRG